MRRTFSRLIVLVALLVVVAFAPVAEAAISAVSPALNGFGFPLWYQDANAVRLQQCMDQVNCIVLADAFFNPALPLVFPTNFPGESFYFFAGARIDTIGPQVLGGATQRNLDLRVVLEASFGGVTAGPVPGEQITFARINLGRITGGPNCGIAPINPLDCVLAPGATYTVTYPYGTFTFTADANGEAISSLGGQAFRQVDGCGVPPFPCNFAAPSAGTLPRTGFPDGARASASRRLHRERRCAADRDG
ncbi:MAG: hypothetical protein MZV65_00300 [Chromatiales bacterium]|nr:hypothetical protein [Chromatiales bacterium]